MLKTYLLLCLLVSGMTANAAASDSSYKGLLTANIISIAGEYSGTIKAADGQFEPVQLSLYPDSIITQMEDSYKTQETPSLLGYLRASTGTTMIVFTKALVHPESFHLQMWGYSNTTNYQSVNVFDATYDGDTLKGTIFTPTYLAPIEFKRRPAKK